MKIILMALDTLRSDHLGCYGHPMDTSPCLDRLAEEGILAERHYSTDVPTPPAYTAMMTGMRGQKTGIFGFGHTNYEFKRSTPMLAQQLAEAGYHNGMISNLLYVCPWIVKGFHEIMPPGLRFQGGTAEEVSAEACRWLDRHHEKDFFLFVHYWDPHQNYFKRAPEAYQRRYRGKDYRGIAPDGRYFEKDPLVLGMARQYAEHNYQGNLDPASYMPIYDACIRYMDDEISHVIEHLRKLSIDEETILLITSDHGEAFGERGFYDHLSCYENISHVPLIVRWPKKARSRRIEGYTMGVDLMPTILDLCGLSMPEGLCGKSLKPCLLEAEDAPHAEVVTNGASIPIQRMYLRDDWALVHTPHKSAYEYLKTYELFDLSRDRAQENDLADREPQRFQAMRSAYDAWLDRELQGMPDKLLGIIQKGGGWSNGLLFQAFYEDPELYFSRESIRKVLMYHLGDAAVRYHRAVVG